MISIVEKLRLNKDSKLSFNDEVGYEDFVLILQPKITDIKKLKGYVARVTKIEHDRKFNRTELTVKYNDNTRGHVGRPTLFILSKQKEDDFTAYAGDGSLLFDRRTAINLINNMLDKEDSIIYQDCELFNDIDLKDIECLETNEKSK